MRDSEKLAKLVVESVLPGARMTFRPAQHSSTFDFDLQLPDGRVAALEVTSVVGEKQVATEAAILDERSGGPFVPRRLCQRDWIVDLRAGANVRNVRKTVDAYLADVEAAQLDRFYPHHRSAVRAVARIFDDLGVEAGWVTELNPTGFIALETDGPEDWLSIGPTNDAVSRVAHKDDNKRKLLAARADQRHLFVCVDPSHRAFVSLREMSGGPLPVLPPFITHVWVAASYGATAIGLHAPYAASAWTRFVVNLPDQV